MGPNAPDDHLIAERAYLIWQREGRPHGREQAHWIQAWWELLGEEAWLRHVEKRGGGRPR